MPPLGYDDSRTCYRRSLAKSGIQYQHLPPPQVLVRDMQPPLSVYIYTRVVKHQVRAELREHQRERLDGGNNFLQ